MKRKTKKEKRLERVKLLLAIKKGEKHTHRNDILAPLAQAALIAYDSRPGDFRAVNVRLTDWGESWLTIELQDFPGIA
jgi:hypothetical protein